MNLLDGISEQLQQGHARATTYLVKEALAVGMAPVVILKHALNESMKEVGKKLTSGEMFAPDALICAYAYDASMEQLKPFLPKETTVCSGNELLQKMISEAKSAPSDLPDNPQ